MKAYRVLLSPRAFRQLAALEAFVEQETGREIARNYREEIVAHCQQLEHFPNRGSSRDDLRPGLRTMVHRRRVTIAFEVGDKAVVILAIVGRGRDIRSALSD